MNKKMQWLKASFSMLILWSLLLNSVPVKAQGDIVTSEDISGGSSVFVFRKSRKAEQAKFAPRSNAKRNEAQKAKSRKLVKDQVSKVIPKRTKIEIPKPTPKPTPVAGKPTPKPTPIKTASPMDASNAIAGGAEVYLERGDIDRAVTMFKESLKLYPDNNLAKAGLSEALTQRADKIFETDGADLSIPVYEEAIKYDNKNAAAYAGLGSAYDVMENSDLTFQNYDKALSLNPNLTELYAPLGITYYQKGEIAKADELLTKAVSAKSEDDQTQFLLGLIRYKQNRNEEAIAALKSSIAITETAEAHYYLGEVYDRLKRDKEAIDEYNKAVTLNPKFAEAWFDLGVAYYNRNRFEDAINAYTQAVKMKNDNYEAHENLADVYRQIAFNSKDEAFSKANYEKAEGSYQLATVLAERNPKAQADKLALSELYSKYGFVLGRLSKWSPNKWSAAINVLTKSTSLNPDSVDYTNLGWAYYNAAQIDLQNKQKDQANIKLAQGRDWLQKAVALDPKSKGALMNLGVTYTDLGDFANAIDALRKSVALDGKWIIAHNELGLAYRGAGNLDEAVKSFRRTVDLDKNFASGLYNWAETEMARGNAKEARELQKRLAKINPGLAERLNYVFADQLRNKVDGKIQEKNPLNKIPKLPF